MVNRDGEDRGDVTRATVNCELVWREISNYLDSEVDAGLRVEMDQHFSTCNGCAAVLEGTRNVVRLYGDERMMEAPAGFGRRLEKRLTQSAQPRNSWFTWGSWLVPVAAMALIAGGLFLVKSPIELAQVQRNRELAAKNIPPDMTVVVTADSKIFHVAGCENIRGKEVKSLTAKQALDQGYAPCMRCLRKYLVAAGVMTDRPVVAAGLDWDVDDDDEPPGGQ
jgi:hypothetical protein